VNSFTHKILLMGILMWVELLISKRAWRVQEPLKGLALEHVVERSEISDVIVRSSAIRGRLEGLDSPAVAIDACLLCQELLFVGEGLGRVEGSVETLRGLRTFFCFRHDLLAATTAR
jgi:hypothetical protein